MEATQAPLSGTETVLIGLIVSALLLPSASWGLVQHFQTMAHEGMHWAVGSLSGRKAWWIELKPNGDGGTLVLPDRGFGYLVVVFAGYLGPSAFGLGAARLIQFGHIIQVLWVGMLLLGLLLLMLKPSFGFITVPLAGFLIFLVLKNMSQRAEILAAYAITWFLLLAGVRRVWQRGTEAGDAGILTDRTSIPRLIWLLLWLAGTGTAVLIGARWMLHPAVQA
jgi:Peptidase M50B-like